LTRAKAPASTTEKGDPDRAVGDEGELHQGRVAAARLRRPKAGGEQRARQAHDEVQQAEDEEEERRAGLLALRLAVLGVRALQAPLERQHGTMRHFIGRMRRLVYAFSKDVAHHKAAVALCYAYYNLCWTPRTLRGHARDAGRGPQERWELGDFMEAILSEPEAAKPTAKPLAPRKPETKARELPNGRGFLRLVLGSGSGCGPAASAPSPPAVPVAVAGGPASTVPVVTAMPSPAPVPAPTPASAKPKAPKAKVEPELAPPAAPVEAEPAPVVTPAPAPEPAPAETPTAPAPGPEAPPSTNEPVAQLDLLAWALKTRTVLPPEKRLDPGQLSIFGIDFEPEKPEKK
jgi:hypothetical protein